VFEIFRWPSKPRRYDNTSFLTSFFGLLAKGLFDNALQPEDIDQAKGQGAAARLLYTRSSVFL
jgi:hypothetical protein